MKKVLLIFILFTITVSLFAQVKSIGKPFITNYSRSNYQAGSQTWDIEQANNGMMYFANNDGLLEFDGYSWQVYPLPNKSILRSIENGNDLVIYAGGFNEIGYYQLGEMGVVNYQSLTHLLHEDQRNFGEVWKIFIHPDGVIFQSFTQIMFYKNNEFSVINAPSTFHFSFMVDNEYYVDDLEHGLMRYAMGSLYPLVGMEKLIGTEIWGILTLNNQLLIVTASKGMYIYNGNSLTPWETSSAQFLSEAQIYSSLQLSNDMFALGTIQNGLLVCDSKGDPIQHLTIDNGLQNNTILSIYKDNSSDLWISTDHGIDFMEGDSPLTLLSNSYGLSTGYSAYVFKEKLYLGTNQGLFVKELLMIKNQGFKSNEMDLIDGTLGQVWTLTEIGNDLFCGHNEGAFIIRGNTAEKITDISGIWSFVQIPGDSSKIISGTYNGFVLYKRENGKWKFSKKITGFNESSRKIAFDKDGTLWMAHGYKGAFHITFNKAYDSIISVEDYHSQNSSLPTNDVYLAKIDEEIIFTGAQKIFMFSSDLNDFNAVEKFNGLLNGKTVRFIEQDTTGDCWYFVDGKTGVLRKTKDGSYNDIWMPFIDLKNEFVRGFESVYYFDEENVIFGIENGFAHYNALIDKDYTFPFQTYLRSMRTVNPDSVYLYNKETIQEPILLDYSSNDIEFIFSANDFENTDQIMFSTFLEGYDKGWSAWQERNIREYTNLDDGRYVFRVKAINIYNTVSNEVSIGFKVKPPIYKSIIAYVIYSIVVLILLIIVIYILQKKVERSKLRSQKEQEIAFRKKEEKLQKENLEAEKQLVELRNEKLRGWIKQKDKELANSTMETLQKNEMLITLRDELKKLVRYSQDEQHQHEVNHLVRKINKEIDNEKQWKIFETQFENVHEEFIKRIKSAHPKLTPRELKLCAFLRMNISSKEMSVLMNISTRGVEISRYRLRKKLNLPRETNLTEFVMSF